MAVIYSPEENAFASSGLDYIPLRYISLEMTAHKQYFQKNSIN